MYIEDGVFGRKEVRMLPLSTIKQAIEDMQGQVQKLEGDYVSFLPDYLGDTTRIVFLFAGDTLFIKPYR